MKWTGFGRSVLFAALAGAAWPAFALAAGALLGMNAAFSLYAVGATAVYVAGLAPNLARGLASAFAAVAIAVTVAAVAGAPGGAALGAALALGIVRSGLLYPSRNARAIAIEALLIGGGLALARFLSAPGALGAALALWGFFLVQSAFFAIGGVRTPDAGGGALDRFERARRRALALLEDEA